MPNDTLTRSRAGHLVSDIVWIGDDQLGAALVPDHGRGAWQILEVSQDAVVASAAAGLVRSFTDIEYTTYGIDPCPTLDEIRARR